MIVERHSVRAILVTPEREVLLIRIHPPDSRDTFWWITPGGGLEAGETVSEGLKRELREELALDEFVIGPLLWRRQHTYDWGDKRIRQYEDYFVVHVARFEPRMSDEVEAQTVDRFRWWRVAELAHTEERLTPLSLAEIVARYLSLGPPQGVLELETIED